MLRDRVMLTGPRREGRGKVSISPQWFAPAGLTWHFLVPVLLWLACCPCALPYCFPPTYYSLPSFIHFLYSWMGVECPDEHSWTVSRVGKSPLCAGLLWPGFQVERVGSWEAGQLSIIDRPVSFPSLGQWTWSLGYYHCVFFFLSWRHIEL